MRREYGENPPAAVVFTFILDAFTTPALWRGGGDAVQPFANHQFLFALISVLDTSPFAVGDVQATRYPIPCSVSRLG